MWGPPHINTDYVHHARRSRFPSHHPFLFLSHLILRKMLLRALLFFIAYLITVAAAAVATNPWYTHLGPNVTSSGNNTHYFEISNNCPFTVWPAVVAGQKEAKWPALTGFELPPQNRRRVATYGTFQGRIWPRLGCFFDSAGIGHCATGDCDSRLECGFKTGEPGVVLAEVNMGGAEGQMFYDISLVDGFDVDVLMEPISTGEWTGDTLVCTCFYRSYILLNIFAYKLLLTHFGEHIGKPSASNLTALFDPGNFRMIPPRNHREPEAWYNHVRPVASDCKRYGSPEYVFT